MAKTTNENKKIIENNLKYIGLDLNKIPKFLTEFEPLNFRPIKSYDDTVYKVYKHINVQDIQILITPTDRLTDIKDKYKLASPLYTYLNEKDEESIEKFAVFLKMVSNLKAEKIEELEEEQLKIKKHLPTKIKYTNHFVWQIYYSDYTQKYFMLVPTNEQDNSALFYLLKKQISSKKSRKKETVFVPISHLEYSGDFLTKSEITDIENYLWYFTKEWPNIYEVYDEKGKLSIKIVGNTNIYEKIKSDYTITLNSKKQSIEFYKLLKAMFILSTGISEEYNFEVAINDEGSLKFLYNDTEMKYNELPKFIELEYKDKVQRLEKEIKEKAKLEKRLKRFNNIVEDLTQEYLLKQRQIATFLECKKTFFGKVKYFFKKKKETPLIKKPEKLDSRSDLKKDEEIEELYKEKEQYTIEDLINICTKLEEKIKMNTNLNLDINEIENKKEILSKKIDNADLYIKEIDSHKKSIFEFWKFTSKDEVQTLNEGQEIENVKNSKFVKYFDYEEDLEDLGKIVDELQRRKLSKNETDAIFAAKQVINSIKELYKGEDKNNNILEEDLEKLKEEYKDNLEYINIKDFDIFGGMSDDKTKIKTINNEKHREIEKDKYKVLNINLQTEVQNYIDNLQGYLNLISESFNKINSPYNMSIYKSSYDDQLNGIDIFNINPQSALEHIEMLKDKDIILNKINIKENMPIIFYSNIIFYDNFNKTLPVGMNLSSEVLVDLNKINKELIKEKEFNMNYNINEFEMVTRKIKLYEYETDIM